MKAHDLGRISMDSIMRNQQTECGDKEEVRIARIAGLEFCPGEKVNFMIRILETGFVMRAFRREKSYR